MKLGYRKLIVSDPAIMFPVCNDAESSHSSDAMYLISSVFAVTLSSVLIMLLLEEELVHLYVDHCGSVFNSVCKKTTGQPTGPRSHLWPHWQSVVRSCSFV